MPAKEPASAVCTDAGSKVEGSASGTRTKVKVKPPTFVFFVNDKELMHFSYVRYLENKIRDTFGFEGTPLRFIVRERGEKG